MADKFAAIVGTVEVSTEKEIVGRSGDHLQFYLRIAGALRYQVDVNIQSSSGAPIEVYVAGNVNAQDVVPDESTGAPDFREYANASLSYARLGLSDAMFAPMSAEQIETQLKAALADASFVVVWGLVFDDGGQNGKGIHETHFDAHGANHDGAIAIYRRDASNNTSSTWHFFKFSEDHIR